MVLIDVERLTGRVERATHSGFANAAHGFDVHAMRLYVVNDTLQFFSSRHRNPGSDTAA
jgi:hypothetical protein